MNDTVTYANVYDSAKKTISTLSAGMKSGDSVSPSGPTPRMTERDINNYPFKDPIFHIPVVPELTIIPDPKPPRKAPLAGYDMKTLRKQIEYLQSEIDDRSDTQQLLFKQNQELWGYCRSLLECNKTNAGLMKRQVRSLHEELCQLHNERLSLAEKLENAEHSKQMLLKMSVELSSARGAVTTAQQLALDAEEALMFVRKESEDLEYVLNKQVRNVITSPSSPVLSVLYDYSRSSDVRLLWLV